MDVTFVRIDPTSSLAIFKGRVCRLQSKTLNLLEIGMVNPTEPCIDNKMSENGRCDVVVLENVEEKNSSDKTENKAETGAFTASLDSTTIPKNIHIVLDCPEWKNVVMEKMKALEKNNIWKICALPKRHKLVGCKWVFTLKYKIDGTFDKF
ncbi:reverse transcriptase [Cucumis melo var. makuwa]|uniref:Reverse transcriptase n=1 Tax=Cucumis melo var. makuwa TaxID=1194695 RepID=A0A5D3C257_CUCMM|nr:reverse transcriptase [Cucumis melo var. makuwa]